MADELIHELSAAYALDALDTDEAREFERHLQECERCREDVAQFAETAAALAYGADSSEPPPQLRARILDAARRDGAQVVELRPRRVQRFVPLAAAAAATVAAIGVGAWAASLSRELDEERSVISVLADPDARSIALRGANGRLVVTKTGEAALVVAGLDRAPEGKTYEAWVIAPGNDPLPAGLFDGAAERDVVRLERAVPRGAQVAVTVEDESGADRPTSDPIFEAPA